MKILHYIFNLMVRQAFLIVEATDQKNLHVIMDLVILNQDS